MLEIPPFQRIFLAGTLTLISYNREKEKLHMKNEIEFLKGTKSQKMGHNYKNRDIFVKAISSQCLFFIYLSLGKDLMEEFQAHSKLFPGLSHNDPGETQRSLLPCKGAQLHGKHPISKEFKTFGITKGIILDLRG